MNRKYLVNTSTRQYLCVALKKGQEWVPNNQKVLESFMDSHATESNPELDLVSGEFNDNTFYEKWIRNGTNFLFR